MQTIAMRLVAVLLFDTRCQCVRVQGPKRRSTCTNNQETAARCAVYLAANACSPACLCLIRTPVVQSRFTNPDAVRSPFAGTSLPVSVSTSLPQVASLTNRRNVVAAVRLLCGCCAAAVRLQSSCSWIGLTKNFKVREDDEDEVPRFIPYFGDSTSEVNAARCSTFAAVVDVAFFLQPGWRGGGTAVHERQAAH